MAGEGRGAAARQRRAAPRKEGAREAAARRSEQRQQPRARAPKPTPETRTMPSQAHRLRRALHSEKALRQAILLREVLGPPVSLRPPGDGPTGLR